MTNVARHSGATRCVVDVDRERPLRADVSATTATARQAPTPGVGWTSMSERAEELGGTCTVS